MRLSLLPVSLHPPLPYTPTPIPQPLTLTLPISYPYSNPNPIFIGLQARGGAATLQLDDVVHIRTQVLHRACAWRGW